MLKVDFFKLHPRLGRVHYLILFLFWNITASVGLSIPILFYPNHFIPRYIVLVFASFIIIPALLNGLYIQIRRLHDFNFNGWWVLMVFVPILNLIFYLALFLVPGSAHYNRYGAPTLSPNKGDYVMALLELITFSVFTFLLGSYIWLKTPFLMPILKPEVTQEVPTNTHQKAS